jgi:hypothetical protein
LGGAATGLGGAGCGFCGATTGLGGAGCGFGGAAAGFAAAGGLAPGAGFAGGFFLGSTEAGACACAAPAKNGTANGTADKIANAGTIVPASSRHLNFMVIPGERKAAQLLFVGRECQRRANRWQCNGGEFVKPI